MIVLVAACLPGIGRTIVDADCLKGGFCGKPAGRTGKVDTRDEVLNLRLDRVEGTGSRNRMDNNLMPDLKLRKASCCKYGCSDSFLDSRVVGVEQIEGMSIVLGDKLDVEIGKELYDDNKRFLDDRVDSPVNSEVVGIIWECCTISLNDNSTVAFGQK